MKIITFDQRTDLRNRLWEINQTAWPKFLLQWDCPGWSSMFTTFAEYQVLLLSDDGDLMAYGHTFPIYWGKNLQKIPDNLERLTEMAVESNQKNIKPNLLLAVAAVVSKQHKGEGLSSEIVQAMKNIAENKGMKYLIVPVRPTLKMKYPLIPIENYATWKREDGLFVDPWLRVHQRLGGQIFKTAKISLNIKGKVKEWEEWTGVNIFGSGQYLFEGVLNPVTVNCEKNIGVYYDPCIWVKYTLN
ncbi:MAG TPA: hypothetical protein VHY08_29890 [Bacillota bacterium]|nr:hypothetical protein [Bacillota bacterium]